MHGREGEMKMMSFRAQEKSKELPSSKERIKERGRERGRENQSPTGIMRSAVPLPYLFDVVKSQKVAGQQPQQGTRSC